MISRLLDQDLRLFIGKVNLAEDIERLLGTSSQNNLIRSRINTFFPSISLGSIGVLLVILLVRKVIEEIILPSNQGFIDTGSEVLESLVAVFL